MSTLDDEDRLLRSVALQNAHSILVARQRAEEELLRTREALRQSEERLLAALTAAATGTFRWNIQTNIVEWDGNLDRLFGLESSRTAQSLDAFLAAVHPDDRATVTARYQQCADEGSDLDLEFRVCWPDGTVHWLHEKARAFTDDDGRAVSVTGACADVSNRRETAEAQQESEERLRAMFEQAAVGIAIAELDGSFVEVNGKFTRILGYGEDELRGMTFADITHPDDLAVTMTAVGRLLDGSIGEYSMEKRYRQKAGGEIWSLTTVTLLRNAAGEPQRFIGVIEDISARKLVEAALHEETRVLELLNETGKMLASTLDLQPLVQAVTDAATELSGAKFGSFFYNTTDEHGESFLLYTLSGAPREAFERFGQPRATPLFGPTFRGERPIRIDDVTRDPRYGTMAPHHGMPKGHLPVRSYLAVPVRSRSGEVIGGLFFGHPQPGVFTERTERLIVGVAAQAGIAIDNARLYEGAQRAAEERKSLLESERAARTAAERMSDVKDEFLATLSHELRTPLNAILGWSRILRSTPADLADQLRGLETIERNARVQTQLIEDLLDMSRINSGKLRLDVQPLQPVTFVEAAVETVQPVGRGQGHPAGNVPRPGGGTDLRRPRAPAAGHLEPVVQRHQVHAQAAARSRCCSSASTRTSRSAWPTPASGSGPSSCSTALRALPPGAMPRPRASTAASASGCRSSRASSSCMAAPSRVKSPGEGRGTTVTVHLPLTVVHRLAAGVRQHPRTPDAGPAAVRAEELAGLKVLVVDDQADARDLIKRVLEDCAATVLTAGSAADALALVERERPDLLVSDIGMPDADGFELLRMVRALGAARGGRVPAIALTAFARSEDRTRALRAGFLVHVAKPVDPSELVATVASVAGRVDDPR